jgi:hypothetical protein
MRKELIRQNRGISLYLHQIDRFSLVHVCSSGNTHSRQLGEYNPSQRVCKSVLLASLGGWDGSGYAKSTFERTKSTLSFFICRIVTCGPCAMSYSPGMAINNTNVLQMHKFHSRWREGKPNPLYAEDGGRATVRSISAAVDIRR